MSAIALVSYNGGCHPIIDHAPYGTGGARGVYSAFLTFRDNRKKGKEGGEGPEVKVGGKRELLILVHLRQVDKAY